MGQTNVSTEGRSSYDGGVRCGTHGNEGTERLECWVTRVPKPPAICLVRAAHGQRPKLLSSRFSG
jgi:hypothetical protein